MKALVYMLAAREYQAVDPDEGHRLVDAGLAVWPAGQSPARPETATAAARETPEGTIEPPGEQPRRRRQRR